MPLSEAEELELLELEEQEAGHAPQAASPSTTPTSSGESALRGAAQGASFGFADELTGAGEAAMKKLSGDEHSLGDLYRTARDESRANYKSAEESHPALYNAPKIAGGVATAVLSKIPVVGPVGGAALGGLQGLGDSEADLTKGDLGGVARDTGIGAATGAAVGTLGSGLKALGGKALTTKIPGKIADTLDVSSWIKNAIAQRSAPEIFNEAAPAATSAAERMFGKAANHGVNRIAEAAAPAALPAMEDVPSAVIKRLGVYSLPGLGQVQKVSDAARATQFVQHGIQHALQNAPEMFGKFAGVLRAAAERGAQSLNTTNFILQQKNPEYQEILKKQRDQQ